MKKAYFIAAMILALAFSTLATHYIYKWTIPHYVPEPKTSSISTFSDGCEFYKKVKYGDFTISEPKGGVYRYEVLATADGIEVWKCNSF